MKIIYYLWYIHSAQPNTEQELSVNLYICESINASLPMLRKQKQKKTWSCEEKKCKNITLSPLQKKYTLQTKVHSKSAKQKMT